MTTPKAPRRFAQDTKVSQEQTVGQIRTALRKYGADGFMTGDEPGRAVIGFRHTLRVYRFDLPMPKFEEFRLTPTKVRRGDQAMITAWQQECDRRFRALLATIKGRLIAVDEGIATFEEEFALETVLPDGKTTVRQYTMPQLQTAFESGRMPALLPGAATLIDTKTAKGGMPDTDLTTEGD